MSAPPASSIAGAVQSGTKQLPTEVVVHPLVLLSVVDHYVRVAKDSKNRVVGILLGETYKGRVDVTNCYAGTSERNRLVWLICTSMFDPPPPSSPI